MSTRSVIRLDELERRVREADSQVRYEITVPTGELMALLAVVRAGLVLNDLGVALAPFRDLPEEAGG